MLWGGDKKKKEEEEKDGVLHLRDEPRPDSLKKPIPREKLPKDLQQLVDCDDDYYDELYSQYSVDTTETPYRYAGYANRIRTILVSAHRYVAYTSDVGESFRPVAHPWLVRSAYAISWSYILGDVGHEGYKAFLRNRRMLIPPGEAYKDATDLTTNHIVRGMATGNISGPLASDSTNSEEGETQDSLVPWPTTRIPLIDDYRMVMVQRAVFQSLASMALPAFTIHSVVRYSGRALKNAKNTLVRTWGPIGLGLAVVPLLPTLFDEPVEHAVEWSFKRLCRAIGGEEAVTPPPRPSKSPAEKSTPLGSLMKLQSRKKRHEEEQQHLHGETPSRKEYNAEKQHGNEGGSWFGWRKKNKDE